MAPDVNKDNATAQNDGKLSDQQNDLNEDLGYYFFPRREDQHARKEPTYFEHFKANPLSVSGVKQHEMCKLNIMKCMKYSKITNTYSCNSSIKFSMTIHVL